MKVHIQNTVKTNILNKNCSYLPMLKIKLHWSSDNTEVKIHTNITVPKLQLSILIRMAEVLKENIQRSKCSQNIHLDVSGSTCIYHLTV